MRPLSRRHFLTSLSMGCVGSTLTGCSNEADPDRYNEGDVALLTEQRRLEAAQTGQSRFGVHRYQGYRGLAELPWFELDEAGDLICVDESIPPAIDVHAHLGMSVLFKPSLDLGKQTTRVKHLLDCDATTPGCELDLDVYVNSNFTPEALKRLRRQLRAQGLWGSSFATTHTIPNLLREMDAMRVQHAMLLPIKFGFWFGDDQTQSWRTAIAEAQQNDRLHAGFSVHPDDDNAIEDLRASAQSGTRLLKLHPTVQRFYPDDPRLLPIYEEAQAFGVTVFFHGGRAGIEPESAHRYAMPRHYEAAFANFPKLQFIIGHAGARDSQAMLDLAQKYTNVWTGIHGQGISRLDKMIEQTKGRRLLFGTDWPFYHIGSSLAKVLIVTQDAGRRATRDAILRENALELFEL